MKAHVFPRVATAVLLLLLFLTFASCAAEEGDRLPTDPAAEDAGSGTEIFTSEESPETVTATPAESSEVPEASSEVPEVSSEVPEASSEVPEVSSEPSTEESTENSPEIDPLTPTEGLAYLRYHNGYGYVDEYVLVGTGSSKATHLVIPSTHKGWRVREIAADAFKGNTEILSVTFTEGTRQLPDALFEGCTSLVSVRLMDGMRSIGNRTFAGCTSLTEVILPAGLDSISDEAFLGCTSLTKIALPEGLQYIGASAFSGCTRLTDVSFFPESVFMGKSAFEDCISLRSMTLPNLSFVSERLFAGCTSLEELVIPDSVNSIGGDAFSGCTGLEKLVIPEGVTSIDGNTFAGCTSLSEILLPAGLERIRVGAFRNCTALVEITIPNGVLLLGSEVFSGCTSLTCVVLPEGLIGIDSFAFQNCTGLLEISIPASVKSIEMSAFSGCTALSRVTFYGIPETVTPDALAECDPEVEIFFKEPPTRDTLLRLSRIFPPDVRVRLADGSDSYAPPFFAYLWSNDLNCMRYYSHTSQPTLPRLEYAPRDTSMEETELVPTTLKINGTEFSVPYKTTFLGDSYGGVPYRSYEDSEAEIWLNLFREDGAIRLFNAYGYYAAAGDPTYRSVTGDADALAIATEFIEAHVYRQNPDVTLADYRMSVRHHTRETAGEEYVGYDFVFFQFVWCPDGVPTKDEIRISVSAGGNILYFYRGNDCSFAAGDTIGLAEAYEYAWGHARYEARRFYQGTVGYVHLVSIDRVHDQLAYRFRVGLPHGAPSEDLYSECQKHYYTELILLRNPEVEVFLSLEEPDGTLAFGGTEGGEAVYSVPAQERETLIDASVAVVTEENIPDREFRLNGRTLNAIYVQTRTGEPEGRGRRVRIYRDAQTGITLGFDAESDALVLLDARDYYDGAGDVPPEGNRTPTATVSAFFAMYTAGKSLRFPEYRYLEISVDAEDSAYSYGYVQYVYTRNFGSLGETPDRPTLYLSDGGNVVYFERGVDYADVEVSDVDVLEADVAVTRWACRYASSLDHGALQRITFSGVAENELGEGLLYRVTYECRSADGESTVSFTETYFYLFEASE